MNLVIVETPAEAKRVTDVLSEGWQVEPCYGAVRGLPADMLGVDVRHDFHPTYTLLPRKGNLVRRLMRAISKADAIYVATPPDQSGETMAWHVLALSPTLGDKPIYRVLLNALTPESIRASFNTRRPLNMNWVEAEVTRSIVDRLVGYLVTPLANKALGTKGPVTRDELICLCLLVERQLKIDSFTPETTWSLVAQLAADEIEFEAQLCNAQGATLAFKSRERADKFASMVANAFVWVDKTAIRTTDRPVPSPYTTVGLLADAERRLGLAPNRTLTVVQTLYEAGWITYANTDSVAVASEAGEATRAYILREYGTDYLPTPSEALKITAGVGCIRPTNVDHLPEDLPGDGAALYGLIWRRFVATCMSPARYRQSAARILSGMSREKPFPLELRTQERILAFDGWLRMYPDVAESDDGVYRAQLADGVTLKLVEVHAVERLSDTPVRYSGAELIAAMMGRGLNRSASYVKAIRALADSGYVQIAGEQIVPSEKGTALTTFVEAHFANVLSIAAAAELNAAFDRIAAGEAERLDVLRAFWASFTPSLGEAVQGVLKHDADRPEQTSYEHRPVVLRPMMEG